MEPLDAVESQQPSPLQNTPSGRFTGSAWADNSAQHDAEGAPPAMDGDTPVIYVDAFGQPVDESGMSDPQHWEADQEGMVDQYDAAEGTAEGVAGSEEQLYTDQYGRPVDPHGYLLDEWGQLLLDASGLPVYAYDEAYEAAPEDAIDEAEAEAEDFADEKEYEELQKQLFEEQQAQGEQPQADEAEADSEDPQEYEDQLQKQPSSEELDSDEQPQQSPPPAFPHR